MALRSTARAAAALFLRSLQRAARLEQGLAARGYTDRLVVLPPPMQASPGAYAAAVSVPAVLAARRSRSPRWRPMTPLLEAVGVHYRYPGAAAAAARVPGQRAEALAGASLAVRAGTRLALLGGNGSGKSTLLLHLNGTLRPAAGEVRFAGAPLDRSRRGLAALRQRVALVFQDPDDQLFAGTLAQDVSFGPLNLGLDAARTGERVAEALRAVGLAAFAGLPLHMLSHGQRKRASIAGALALRPQALLLDEPTAGLDPAGGGYAARSSRGAACRGADPGVLHP